MSDLLSYAREDVDHVSSEIGSPEWIVEKRTKAWKAFENLPLPTIRDEMWKYTDFSSIDFKGTKPLSEPNFGLVEKFDKFPKEAISLLSDEAILANCTAKRVNALWAIGNCRASFSKDGIRHGVAAIVNAARARDDVSPDK